ncbi:hypothetical protein [Chryseobacterium polytrichastri]|uniref:Uncharacterized protein n=1 Tax=Chryseobacterium polytrichastri TaxID=1302687 RepID=A0A1M7EHS9_9FLAO|nr:hypothetical protein [Chryseobacterium polytrichastri]SHL91233.1 hypothetical protein SAMN05444267_102836 [Chryseobacterium polytrichastri]
MRIFLLLICFSISILSCKKEAESHSNINLGFHEDLVKSKLAKDSLQKMDVVFDKLNKKNTNFLDYYVHYYYKLDKETQEEIKKSKGENFLSEHPEEYFALFTKIISEKDDKYLASFGITKDEEMLAREVYIFHLKKNYGPTVDGQLENLNK